MNYQTAFKTIKGRKKEQHEKNGDFLQQFESQDCVVLALADGVGSCANDARAAQNTCSFFVGKCRDAVLQSGRLTEENIMRFCKEIDPILKVDGDMACFCAIVWYVNEDDAVFIHVGDTRIYSFTASSGLVQLSHDDHGKAVNVKIGGKVYTDHGVVVPAVPVDKAIGDGQLLYHTGKIPFREGECLILCSDGMYSSASFASDLAHIVERPVMSEAISALSTSDDDDASVLIIRRDMAISDTPSIESIMSDFEHYRQTLPLSNIIGLFSDSLEAMLKANVNPDAIEAVLGFAKERQLYPDKQRIERLFKTACDIHNAMPEGEQKARYNAICFALKDMLRYVFTH